MKLNSDEEKNISYEAIFSKKKNLKLSLQLSIINFIGQKSDT